MPMKRSSRPPSFICWASLTLAPGSIIISIIRTSSMTLASHLLRKFRGVQPAEGASLKSTTRRRWMPISGFTRSPMSRSISPMTATCASCSSIMTLSWPTGAFPLRETSEAIWPRGERSTLIGSLRRGWRRPGTLPVNAGWTTWESISSTRRAGGMLWRPI